MYRAAINHFIILINNHLNHVKDKWLECVCVSLRLQHMFNISARNLGPNLLCCITFLTYGCIFTTTNRRSSNTCPTLKVSAKLHPEDLYVRIGMSRLAFRNCKCKYSKRKRQKQPKAVFNQE